MTLLLKGNWLLYIYCMHQRVFECAGKSKSTSSYLWQYRLTFSPPETRRARTTRRATRRILPRSTRRRRGWRGQSTPCRPLMRGGQQRIFPCMNEKNFEAFSTRSYSSWTRRSAPRSSPPATGRRRGLSPAGSWSGRPSRASWTRSPRRSTCQSPRRSGGREGSRRSGYLFPKLFAVLDTRERL